MEKMMSEGSIPLGFSQNLVSESNPPVQKKKRNLPGNPDPEAEVIALSPKTLMATNRFVCEVCGKGFQRDQNLQLHRRGHNLPWKLKQRSNKEAVRKRVYVCPEKSCVHNHPSRALGDLTGIKKHFCRKHGEKKHKCDKCSKWYAVRSDWKAHSKTCGTREYRCDCGSIFSRRDSFITHRAFCEALAEETAKLNATSQFNTFSPTANINIHHPHFMGTPLFLQPNTPQNHFFPLISQIDHKTDQTQTQTPQPGSLSFWLNTNQVSQPLNNHTFIQNHNNNNNIHGFGSLPEPDPFLSSSSSHSISSLYSKQHQIPICQTDLSSAQHSATALLQKAAQIGAASSTGFGGFKINDGGKLGCDDQLFGSSSIVTCMGSDDRETENSNKEFGANAAKRRRIMDGGNGDGDGGKTRDFLGVHEICHPPSINGWL